MDLWSAAAALIRVAANRWLGRQQSREASRFRFDGSLELLRVVSELVAARTLESTSSDWTERADAKKSRADTS
jgi:hypothetical protein